MANTRNQQLKVYNVFKNGIENVLDTHLITDQGFTYACNVDLTQSVIRPARSSKPLFNTTSAMLVKENLDGKSRMIGFPVPVKYVPFNNRVYSVPSSDEGGRLTQTFWDAPNARIVQQSLYQKIGGLKVSSNAQVKDLNPYAELTTQLGISTEPKHKDDEANYKPIIHSYSHNFPFRVVQEMDYIHNQLSKAYTSYNPDVDDIQSAISSAKAIQADIVDRLTTAINVLEGLNTQRIIDDGATMPDIFDGVAKGSSEFSTIYRLIAIVPDATDKDKVYREVGYYTFVLRDKLKAIFEWYSKRTYFEYIPAVADLQKLEIDEVVSRDKFYYAQYLLYSLTTKVNFKEGIYRYGSDKYEANKNYFTALVDFIDQFTKDVVKEYPNLIGDTVYKPTATVEEQKRISDILAGNLGNTNANIGTDNIQFRDSIPARNILVIWHSILNIYASKDYRLITGQNANYLGVELRILSEGSLVQRTAVQGFDYNKAYMESTDSITAYLGKLSLFRDRLIKARDTILDLKLDDTIINTAHKYRVTINDIASNTIVGTLPYDEFIIDEPPATLDFDFHIERPAKYEILIERQDINKTYYRLLDKVPITTTTEMETVRIRGWSPTAKKDEHWYNMIYLQKILASMDKDFNLIALHNGSIFLGKTGSQDIWFSEPNQPNFVKATNNLKTSQALVGMASTGAGLFLFTDDDALYLLTGYVNDGGGNNTLAIKRVASGVVPLNHNAIVAIDNLLLWLSKDGIHNTSGYGSSRGTRDVWRPDEEWGTVIDSAIHQGCAYFLYDKGMLVEYDYEKRRVLLYNPNLKYRLNENSKQLVIDYGQNTDETYKNMLSLSTFEGDLYSVIDYQHPENQPSTQSFNRVFKGDELIPFTATLKTFGGYSFDVRKRFHNIVIALDDEPYHDGANYGTNDGAITTKADKTYVEVYIDRRLISLYTVTGYNTARLQLPQTNNVGYGITFKITGTHKVRSIRLRYTTIDFED